MPALNPQTLAQQLKAQRDRLLQVTKQQPGGGGTATAASERINKRKRSQQSDDKIGHFKPPRGQRDDANTRSSQPARKKQKPTVPRESQQPSEPAPAPRNKPQPQPRRAATGMQSSTSIRPARAHHKATPQSALDDDNSAQQQEAEESEDEAGSDASATALADSRRAVAPPPAKRIKNPQVYLDMAVEGKPVGRLVIELFQYASPRTVANFRALCTGERGVGSSGRPLHYLHSRVHRIDPSFAIQLGDITAGDGTGGDSIYGAATFAHEPSHRRHSGFGTLSTSAALHATDGASSTFFIATAHSPLRWLDKRHTVFGQVVRGKQTLLDIERLAGRKKGGAPKAVVTVVGCGSMRKEQKEQEEGKRRQRHEAQVERAKGKVGLVCPRCESAGRVNKKTRKGVRVWCTDEECQYCWYEAPHDWTEEKKAAFEVREAKRREEEDEKLREEEERMAEMEGEEGEEGEEEDEDSEGRERQGEEDDGEEDEDEEDDEDD